jgi:HEAT repeat protein
MLPQPTIRRAEPLGLAGLLAAALLVSGCAARQSARDDFDRTPRPFVPLPDEDPASIGYFLTRYDASLGQWSQLKMDASSVRDQRTLEALERSLEKRARERSDEILREFEVGPRVNRRIAAVALGFTHDASFLGPLLGGLSENDPELVQKCLLGLGVLGQPETPLAGIRNLLLRGDEVWTRNNAAFALLCLAQSGSRDVDLVEACRDGCLDSEAGVRAQCASALGVAEDPGAVSILIGLLHDESNLVALGAAAALAKIGRADPPSKGAIARGLSGALDQVRTDRRRHLLGALRILSGQDLGEDTEPWVEWARRLP